MAEYVEKQALLQKVQEFKGFFQDNISSAHVMLKDEIKDIVDDMVPEDVAPVVHGRWIFNDDWWEFRCTECHRAIGNIEKYNYCPHCGAKMDGGEKDAKVPT